MKTLVIIKTSRFIFCIVCFFLYFFTPIFGYNFSADRTRIAAEIEKTGSRPGDVNLAIVFETREQEQLKSQTDLQQLKKEFSYQMSELYRTADPVIVAEIMTQNRLTAQDIKDKEEIRRQFAARTDSNHIVVVVITPESRTVLFNYAVYKPEGFLASFSSTHPSEENQRVPQTTYNTSVPDNSQSGQSSYSENKFARMFPLGTYNRTSNDSWFFFQQSAVLIPQVHSVEAVLWLKNISGVDLPPRLGRYDIRYERFQFGLQAYSTDDTGYDMHSSYATIKIGLIDDRMFRFPIYLAIGGKRALYYRTDNPDLKYARNEDTEDENLKKNLNSLFAALTFRLDDYGIIANTYLDNVYFTAGAKLILHDAVRFGIDYQRLLPDTDYEKNDFAAVLEILSADSLIFYLANRDISNQWLLGVKFSVF